MRMAGACGRASERPKFDWPVDGADDILMPRRPDSISRCASLRLRRLRLGAPGARLYAARADS